MSLRLLVALALAFAPVVAAARCIARSGEHTAALVELYTSGTCSGCPSAEHWLSRLGERFPAVIAIALHVDYRDYVGDRNPYARRKLLLLQKMALVYTPQILLQGRDFPDWDSRAFEAAAERINAQPARARLALEIRSVQPGSLAATVLAQIVDPAQRRDAAVYVAAFERRPARGSVVLEWQGPLSPRPDGRFAEDLELPLLPGARPGSSGVASFVQNRRTAEVLQAVLLAACSP